MQLTIFKQMYAHNKPLHSLLSTFSRCPETISGVLLRACSFILRCDCAAYSTQTWHFFSYQESRAQNHLSPVYFSAALEASVLRYRWHKLAIEVVLCMSALCFCFHWSLRYYITPMAQYQAPILVVPAERLNLFRLSTRFTSFKAFFEPRCC